MLGTLASPTNEVSHAAASSALPLVNDLFNKMLKVVVDEYGFGRVQGSRGEKLLIVFNEGENLRGMEDQKDVVRIRKVKCNGVTTSTDSGFTAVTGASQYLIMPKHMSKELAEPMNINWKTSSIHRFENG